MRKVIGLIAVMGLFALAGCGDTGTSVQQPTIPVQPPPAGTTVSAPTVTIEVPTIPAEAAATTTVALPTPAVLAKAVLATSELVVGKDRFVFGLLDSEKGQPINYQPQVSIQFFKVNDDGTAMKTGDGEVVYRSENLPAGVYVVQTVFDKPGNWGALVTIQRENEAAYSQKMDFAVVTDSAVPLPGEDVPRSKSLILSDVKDLGEICSAVPHDDMHDMTIEQAVTSGKPSVILFAAPGFCPSFTCGPDLQLVQKLKEKYGDKANYLHIEAPNEIQNHAHEGEVDEHHNQEEGHQGVNKPQVKAAAEWGLKTEPWLFIVDKDGKLSSRFEGGLTIDEVEPEFQKVIQ